MLYPNRSWLSDEELASLMDALGHPLRQILTVSAVIERHTEIPLDFLPAASADGPAPHRDDLAPWALTGAERWLPRSWDRFVGTTG